MWNKFQSERKKIGVLIFGRMISILPHCATRSVILFYIEKVKFTLLITILERHYVQLGYRLFPPHRAIGMSNNRIFKLLEVKLNLLRKRMTPLQPFQM